ncbi:MAG: transposase [Chloroflexota bacterium]
MPDQSFELLSIPRETARAARAVFGQGNFYILAGEQLPSLLQGITFETRTKPGIDSVIPALVTFFQFLEGLTDVKAIDALRTRIDWKFALHLPVNPPLFHESALCNFRQRILSNSRHQATYQILISRLLTLSTRRRHPSPGRMSLNLVSHVCSLNRMDWLQEAMSRAIEAMACKSPESLRKIALPHWYGRYGRSTSSLDFAATQGQPATSAEEIRADIRHLLGEVRRLGCLEMNQLREVKALDQVWKQQFEQSDRTSNRKDRIVDILLDCEYCTFKAGGKELPRNNEQPYSLLRKFTNHQ